MRAYRALLRLYPASFRAEYGDELCAIFRERRRDATGPLALAALWLGAARGFTLTAILIVGLGIGANPAAFSVTDFVLIRPLPFPEPDRLVKLWQRVPGYSRMELSPPNYADWKRLSTSFERMGAYNTMSVNFVGRGEPERVSGVLASADLLPTLGVQPAIG